MVSAYQGIVSFEAKNIVNFQTIFTKEVLKAKVWLSLSHEI